MSHDWTTRRCFNRGPDVANKPFCFGVHRSRCFNDFPERMQPSFGIPVGTLTVREYGQAAEVPPFGGAGIAAKAFGQFSGRGRSQFFA